MTIVNLFLVFLNILIFATILWIKHRRKTKLVNLKKKHKQDLVKYQAQLYARIDYHKGRR